MDSDYADRSPADAVPNLQMFMGRLGRHGCSSLLAGARRFQGNSLSADVNQGAFSCHGNEGLWCSLCNCAANDVHLISAEHQYNINLHSSIFGRTPSASECRILINELLLTKKGLAGFDPTQLAVLHTAHIQGKIFTVSEVFVESRVEGCMVTESEISSGHPIDRRACLTLG